MEAAGLTDGQGRALSGHRSKAYEGYAKRTDKRALIATEGAASSSRQNKGAQSFRIRHRKSFRMGTMRTKVGLRKMFKQFRDFVRTATWRSGYAAVCKTVYPGSIPGVASKPLI
jgi:hypothetical protein